MEDRELLEMAAKAAGYQVDTGFADCPLIFGEDAGHDGPREWNPLEDDGDALRLAAVIPACVVIDGDMKWCGVHLHGSRGKYDLVEPMGDDPCAATRRAIVRAAAEIGKKMEEKEDEQ